MPEMIPDKSGRLIGIHDRPGNWKLSAYERDCIFQDYLKWRIASSATADMSQWVNETSERTKVSKNRIMALIREGLGVHPDGSPCDDPSWKWWVGCSLGKE